MKENEMSNDKRFTLVFGVGELPWAVLDTEKGMFVMCDHKMRPA